MNLAEPRSSHMALDTVTVFAMGKVGRKFPSKVINHQLRALDAQTKRNADKSLNNNNAALFPPAIKEIHLGVRSSDGRTPMGGSMQMRFTDARQEKKK